MRTDPGTSRTLTRAVLAWYAPRRAAYPWRTAAPDPYRVLVSEVMLQQTQAARVAPAFEAFVARFPGVRSLASAPRAEVLRAWGRLGYPRRAVSLHEAARAIVRDHDGIVPRSDADLRSLPGVGPYTAAAVASLAFGEPVAAVDVNVRRVWARVERGAEPDEVPARELDDVAQRWVPRDRPAEWNQALMDLGREVCRPTPRCELCPLRRRCVFAASGRVGRRSTRRATPFRGSAREARGLVTAALRERSPRTYGGLATETGLPAERLLDAVAGLARDGVVTASPGAIEGRARGRVAFPESLPVDRGRARPDQR